VHPGIVGEWSVKDVLAHLTEWQQMVLGWYHAGQAGETPALPAPGFKWSELPALNQAIYEKHLDRPLPAVLEEFRTAYRQVTAWVESLSEEDLFTPGAPAATIAGLGPNCAKGYAPAKDDGAVVR